MDTHDPAIATRSLGRDYGSTRALESLDLEVPRGALVGLLGPNGAGKTTTMLLLATLLKPSRGSARVFGLDVTSQRPAIRRRLGLVFQEASVDGLLTVEENLLFGARLTGLGRTRGYHQAMVSQRAIFVDAGFLLAVGGTQVAGTSLRSAFRVDFEKLSSIGQL